MIFFLMNQIGELPVIYIKKKIRTTTQHQTSQQTHRPTPWLFILLNDDYLLYQQNYLVA
jgi:ATP-dependent Clp protease adapter protein ClpS